MESDTDDPRSSELETLEAIYPEIQKDGNDPFTFTLELPVEPPSPITIDFPAATAPEDGETPIDTREVSCLPALELKISLSQGYPAEKGLKVQLTTTPPWLKAETIQELEQDAERLWEECGRDMVAYTYIDHLHRATEDMFGIVTNGEALTVDEEHKLAILDHDIKAKRTAFENETFDCGICLDPKKGVKCHKMLDCGHIFCLQCLHDFYNDAIEQGSIDTVRCLMPNCAKEREAAQGQADTSRKPRTGISPSELLQIGLDQSTIRRYVTLRYKIELEADKTTVYCPRQWCNGAARSKRHKKPSTVDFAEAPEEDAQSDDEGKEATTKTPGKFDRSELVAVCEDCGYAFCSMCMQSWHGEYFICRPKRDQAELTEEEKATIEYIKLHTSPCPTCSAPAQKTHGCNHMICSRCQTHFCYLCSAWLDPGNPYQHYNKQPNGRLTSCYMRLWELEGGDGDDVGLGFLGGYAAAPPDAPGEIPDAVLADIPRPVIEEPESDSDESMADPGDYQMDGNRRPVEVAREAPLVLRLVDNQGADRRRPIPPPAPAAPHAADGGNRAIRGRGRGRGGGRGGDRGRGRGGGRNRGGNVRVERGEQQNQQQPVLVDENGLLDEAEEQWVRRFVDMALRDVEHLVEDDSDDDEVPPWGIW